MHLFEANRTYLKASKIREIRSEVQQILDKVLADQKLHIGILGDIHPNHQKSAINLLNYISLRSSDLRGIQRKLGFLGMSRLARAESHTEVSLKTTLYYLNKLLGEEHRFPDRYAISIKASEKLLKRKTKDLLGGGFEKRRLRIMVTIPSVAADDGYLIEEMIRKGMDIARINCAHDSPETWLKMIQHIRNAENATGRKVKISMDLNGPKIRTGQLEKSIQVFTGDHLILTKLRMVGKASQLMPDNGTIVPAIVSCTLPQALDYVQQYDTVYFDDGGIKGTVLEKGTDELLIQIIRADELGSSLKADKGINFPDTIIPVHGLTDSDKEDLRFVAKYADMVNFSYVNSRSDVEEMIDELTMLGVHDTLGVVLKIETQLAYNNLIDILLAAMRLPKIGVMIARGDLAVEAGWGRMGVIQREMLAICSACHVPIIWATQVLENLAKRGYPSRSEITDAVNGTKADCVMLNKGKHIIKAIDVLNQIIFDLEMHQDKNAPMLPMLKKIGASKSMVD